MQKFELISIYDRVAGTYSLPYPVVSARVGCRSISDFLVACPDSDYAKHIGDYDVFSVGTFDNGSGVMVSDVIFVCRLVDLLLKKEGGAVGDSSPEVKAVDEVNTAQGE